MGIKGSQVLKARRSDTRCVSEKHQLLSSRITKMVTQMVPHEDEDVILLSPPLAMSVFKKIKSHLLCVNLNHTLHTLLHTFPLVLFTRV